MLRQRKTLLGATLLASLAVTTGTAAQAQITVLHANLTNGAENPPTNPTLTAGNGGGARPTSFGTATFMLDQSTLGSPFMTFTATIFNIDFTGSQTADTNDNLTNAHIHASPTVTPTTNAGVVWGFQGAPLNDNAPNDVVFTPFASGVGGTISGKWDTNEGNGTTLTAQIPNIITTHSYINFHTQQFGGGEIRGFLIVAPEPSSLALLATGGAGFLGMAVRRRRRAVGGRR